MRSAVSCVRDCLSVLLDALVAPTAKADSGSTSNQPSCCWDYVISIHSCLKATGNRVKETKSLLS